MGCLFVCLWARLSFVCLLVCGGIVGLFVCMNGGYVFASLCVDFFICLCVAVCVSLCLVVSVGVCLSKSLLFVYLKCLFVYTCDYV